MSVQINSSDVPKPVTGPREWNKWPIRDMKPGQWFEGPLAKMGYFQTRAWLYKRNYGWVLKVRRSDNGCVVERIS